MKPLKDGAIAKIASEIGFVRNDLFRNRYTVFVVQLRNLHESAATPASFKSGFSAFSQTAFPAREKLQRREQFLISKRAWARVCGIYTQDQYNYLEYVSKILRDHGAADRLRDSRLAETAVLAINGV
jgi:hypothetical protein